jgi:hypothetical protein
VTKFLSETKVIIVLACQHIPFRVKSEINLGLVEGVEIKP